jgi:hypothetical protein
MQGYQFFHSLDLDNDAIFNEKVDTVSGLKFDAFINNREPHLVLEMQAVDAELVVEARLVCAFKHASAERGVHFDCGLKDSTRDDFVEH